MAKRILSILLSLIMMVGVFSVAAFADPTSYDLYVNGELITSEKLTVKCGEGTAPYNPAEKTLTLNNAEITESNLAADNYGIRAKGSDDLSIKLIGNNKINLPEKGGIMVNDDVYIYGDGKLTMEVLWGGISALDNVGIYEKAELDIMTHGGIAIASENNVYIDNSKVKAVGFDAGIDASMLEIKNKSDIELEAIEEERNAAFIRNTQTGGAGHIKIIDSNVKAKSYYPALYSVGYITVDGGRVESTSTADSAIWAIKDITLKGGAKLVLNGKYPAGCGGKFYLEATEVNAKNTNEENIPAIDYEGDGLMVDEDYHFTYAMAVDSEKKERDLLKNNETQFLNLYKEVHFITEAVIDRLEFLFVKEVKLGGNTAPGKQTFELEIFGIGHGNAEEYKNVTVTAKVETNGAKEYVETFAITGPKKQVREFVSEGLRIREKNDGKANWKYSDAMYEIMPQRDDSGDILLYVIQPIKLVMTPNGANYEPTGKPVDKMTFVNIYTENRDSTTIHIENPNRKPDEKNPNTGAEVSTAPAVLVLKKRG